MNGMFSIIISSICMTAGLFCGVLLWMHRKDVPDRSRIYLSLLCFALAVASTFFTFIGIEGKLPDQGVIMPLLPIGGLYAISLFMCYPIEVLRPRKLRGWWLVLLFVPSLLVTLPVLFGMHFQYLNSWSEMMAHWSDGDVLLRLLCVLLVGFISLILLVIPYNWSKSSADRTWVQTVTTIAFTISVLFFANAFTNLPLFFYLHYMVFIVSMVYLVYYELVERIIPSNKAELTASEKALLVAREPLEGDLWPQICQAMDEWEIWRDPNTTVESLSADIGTNRIYVANSIRENTGLTFNDFLNKKRVEFMARQLLRNPKYNQRSLFFEVGFRNRQTAYRNFVKFMGCSPTEYIVRN